MKFPPWIRQAARKNKISLRCGLSANIKKDLKRFSLHTICNEALCPNKGECFSNGEATFLILGDICTRNCSFCSVKKNRVPLPPEPENSRICELVLKWKLNYVVFTSPTRDDLADGGARQFADLTTRLKKRIPHIKTEPLVPDFGGKIKSLEKVLHSSPDVLGHNIETVPSLYPKIRRGANYKTSLEILKNSKKINPAVLTKTAIMLGMGEKREELLRLFDDLAKSGVDILYAGQYIAPGKGYYPVAKYYTPDEFAELNEESQKFPFKATLFGPLVRSSYKARQTYLKALKNE
mgnify:CR=1 FL=1